MPSGSSVAVRVLAMLAQRTDHDEFPKKITEALDAHAAFIDQYPSAYSYMLAGADEWFSGAIGTRQYAARGHVAAEAVITPAQSIRLHLSIDDGWLVPAHDASKSGVAAIDVSLDDDSPWQLVSIRYPEPQFAEFNTESVPVYRGEVELTAQLERRADITSPPSTRIVPLTVRLQSCRDEICLDPENLRLELSH